MNKYIVSDKISRGAEGGIGMSERWRSVYSGLVQGYLAHKKHPNPKPSAFSPKSKTQNAESAGLNDQPGAGRGGSTQGPSEGYSIQLGSLINFTMPC